MTTTSDGMANNQKVFTSLSLMGSEEPLPFIHYDPERGYTPPRTGMSLCLGRFSGDVVRSRVRDLKQLHSGSTFEHLRQDLQDIRILLAVVRLRVLFLIPETNGYYLIPFWGDERDLISKSLLFPEHGNNFVLKSAGKLRRTIGLELHTDVASIHFNLPGWTGERDNYWGLLEEFQVTVEGNPMPSMD